MHHFVDIEIQRALLSTLFLQFGDKNGLQSFNFYEMNFLFQDLGLISSIKAAYNVSWII